MELIIDPEEEMDPPDLLMPYLFINHHDDPPHQFEILCLATSVFRDETVTLPKDYNFLFSDGLWALMTKFEEHSNRFKTILFSLEQTTVKHILVHDPQLIHLQRNDCIGTFHGRVDRNDYQMYLLEPPDNIQDGGDFLWRSVVPNILGDGHILNDPIDLENNDDNVWGFELAGEFTWTRLQLNGAFNGAHGLMFWRQILFWITSVGIDSFNLLSIVHLHHNFNPPFHFVDDHHGLGPRIYLVARDSGIFIISCITDQVVRIEKLQGNTVQPFPYQIENGTVFVNRGQAGIWIEYLDSLHDDLGPMEDTICEGPPVPHDLGMYYFYDREWRHPMPCNLPNCQGIWFLSGNTQFIFK